MMPCTRYFWLFLLTSSLHSIVTDAEFSPFAMDHTSSSSPRYVPSSSLARYPSILSTSTSLPPSLSLLSKRNSFATSLPSFSAPLPSPLVSFTRPRNDTCELESKGKVDLLSRIRTNGNIESSTFGDLESQVFQYLERAHALLIQYAERSKKEIDTLRQKEHMMNEEFSKVNTVAGNTDQALALCQSNLNALESSMSEVYIREKDASRSATSLEEENQLLRERLRKLSRIEIKRVEVEKVNLSVNETMTVHQLIQSTTPVTNPLMTKAAIVYNNKTVAIFNTIRYTMDDAYNLHIEDVVKKIRIPIIKGFDHLKIVRVNGTYRLTLANQRGNMFFEHKKFDKFYSLVPTDMKLLKSTAIISDKPINWVEHNTRCGFFACFFLKPSSIEVSPDVISTRDKSRIGSLSSFVAYFNFMDFIVSTVSQDGVVSEVKFTSPYLDKDKQGTLVIRDNLPASAVAGNIALAHETRRLSIKLDHSSVDIIDRVTFAQMIQSAFP